MQNEIVCQGRRLNGAQFDWLCEWIGRHRHWSRKRLARELCQQWDWRNGRGQLKDFAARSFLEKLEQRGLVILPPLQGLRSHPRPQAVPQPEGDWPTVPVEGSLSRLQPVRWLRPAAGSPEAGRFAAYVGHYHYLGLRVVGETSGI